ncbi:MAG: serine hydrolase [Rhizobiaceae bacterium]|nr:serine hydrolase [Rhizobiaceae bacterium]
MANKSTQNGFDMARLGLIDEWMHRNIEIGRYTGCSVLVARNGEIAHLSCAGLSSVERQFFYGRDTIVRIKSMTKMITTVGFMMLVERGLIHLDAPLSAILPEFDTCHALVDGAKRIDQVEPVAPPTLHQLLTHTSGMTYGFNPGVLAEHYANIGLDFGPTTGGTEAVCKRVAEQPLAFRPGTSWEYSIGVDVIGRLIEVIDGRPLDQYLEEEVFVPLGMADTGFEVPHGKVHRFADCYTKTAEDPLVCTDRGESSPYLEGQARTFSGGGGLVSTLDDYFKFGEMIRNFGRYDGGMLLSPRTVDFMRRNHLKGEISSMGPSSFAEMPMDGMGFGLGGAVVLDPARTRTVGSIGDYGWGGLASTNFWTDPVQHLTCIFFTQLIPSSSYPSRAELKALVHAALID